MISLFQKVREWSRRTRDRSFLAAPGTHASRDLGTAAADISVLMHIPASVRRRMDRMARLWDVSPRAIDEERWRTVEMTLACGRCDERKRCARHLDGLTVDDPAEYCPNAAHFAELAGAADRAVS